MSKKITKKLQKSISTMVMITTIVWMSGIAMIAPVVPVVEAATYDKVTLTDITSTSQKIAPNGESVLGVIKLDMTAGDIGTYYKTLKYLTATFAQVSGTFVAGTATSLTGSTTGLENIANSTSSGIQLYQDSGSTDGVFDSDDGRVAVDVTGTVAHTSLAYDTSLTGLSSNYMTTLKASLIFGTDGSGGPSVSATDTSIFYLVLLTEAAGATTAGTFTATVDGAAYIGNQGTPVSYPASIAPTSFVTKNITPGNDNVAPSVSKIEIEDISPDGVIDRAKIYFDESMSNAVVSSARWYVQNATTDTTNTTVSARTSDSIFTLTSASKALAGEYVAGVTTTGVLASGVGKLISSKSGSTITLGAALTSVLADDVILEVPSAAPAYIQATATGEGWDTTTQIFTSDNVAMDVGTFHVGDYVAVVDASAKSVLKITKVLAATSTGSSITLADTFTWTPADDDVIIEVAGYGLAATGAWSTTTNVNDTFTINVENFTLPYSGVTLNFGYYDNSTFTGVFGAGSKFKDATGTVMSETSSMTTTDKAKPYAKKAYLYDNDGNGRVDELRVTFSEPLGTSSISTGFALKNTSLTPDKTYTLTGVNGFVKGAEAYSEAGDTIKIAIQEESSDVSDNFTLNYTEGSSQVVDAAVVGNDAISVTQIGAANVSMAIKPVVTKIEVKDSNFNGKIDTIEVTCSCALVDPSGTAENDFSVSGYAINAATSSITSTKVFTIGLTEGSIYDTDIIPDVTYTNDGDADYLHCGNTDYVLENVTGIDEADKAAPILISQTLYETDSDDIWDVGETVQLFFSEAIDASSIATSWSGDAFGDFGVAGLNLVDTPDSGLMSVDGKVVTLTASENATGTLTTSDYIRPVENEVKDAAGNSARDHLTPTFLTVTPNTAPTVDLINTLDENDNGIVDALAINFNGIVDGSTITASDFTAARGSNFSIAAATGEAATSTSPISPDLTISEVVTQNGGNDSTVIVRFTEVNEDTGAHPQVKYVEGALADLAGNKVATFNAYSSDNTKFETVITQDTRDKVIPKVMEIRLKDRNANNKYDQLMVTYSEAVRNDDNNIASAGTNGVLSSTGWAIADHTVAASGYVYDNTNTALTYATTNAVFKVDINEISGSETAVPEVTYNGSGITKDAWSNILAAVAAGDITEVSEITDLTPATEIVDGDVARIGTAAEVYIIKIVGSNKYKRHIVSPEVFNSYGHLSWSAIKSVSDLDAYSLSAWVRSNTGPNETPAATDKVYEVNADSTMHWLNMTAAQFYARGGSDEAIYNVNDGELGLYTLGVDVLYE